MKQLIATIRAHVDAGKLEHALAAAIDAWRAKRAPVLAELVDALDALDARGERTPVTVPTAAWLDDAKEATSARARGALLRTVTKRPAYDITHAVEAAEDWQDPRLVTQIIALLAALPFSGTRTRDSWRRIFLVAGHLRDPRMLAFEKRTAEVWNVGDSMKKWLTNRLEEANRLVVPVELPEADTAALRAFVAELRPVVATTEVTEESLLAAIYANPDDDGPRLVYADWLQERDDPRGEFIALQLAATQDAASVKRQRALAKKHKKAWLGPLAPVLAADVEFRRGFVAKGTVKFRHQRDAEEHGAHPEWATLEDLDWADLMVRDDQLGWSHYVGPTMTNARHMKGGHIRWLIAAKQPFRVETLYMHYGEREADEFRALCTSPNVPRLQTVRLPHYVKDDWFVRIGTCPPNLEWHGRIDNTLLPQWLSALAETPLQRFTVLYAFVKYHFTRDTRGAFTRLVAAIHPTEPLDSIDPPPRHVDTVHEGMSELRAGLLTHVEVTIEHDGTMVALPAATEIAAQKLSR